MRSLSYGLSRYVFHPLWDLKDRSIRLRTLGELERSQWRSEPEMRDRQRRLLGETLRHAQRTSAYYRALFASINFDAAKFSLAEFQKIPLLTKQIIRTRQDDMLCDGLDRSRLTMHKTGGSTGTSVSVFLDDHWLQVRGADAMRSDQWAGHFHGMKTASVWGNPPIARTLKERIRNALYDRMFYLDTMNINPKSLGEFVTTWRREQPHTLFGHSHSLYIVAKYLREQNICDLRPTGIIATSMMLIPSERAVIEAAFGCAVTNRYGCEEVGLIASECERHNGMHLNIEHLFIEVLTPEGKPCAPGEEGKIVVTDLVNRSMPIIRYRVEDVGVLSAERCACGRGQPLLDKLVGRTADYLRKVDGSHVAGVSLVERTLTAIPGIEQMQIVQPELHKIVLNVVPAADYSPAAEAALLAEFHQVFGADTNFDVRRVEKIPQERSGKYRFSICQIPD